MAIRSSYYRYNTSDDNSTISNGWDAYNHLTSFYSNYDFTNDGYPRDFTGFVIQYIKDGEIVSSQEFADDEVGRQKMMDVKNDILKMREEQAKKAVFRLTNLGLQDDRIIGMEDNEMVDKTDEVFNELKNGIKRTVYADSAIVDFLSTKEPTIFEGWNLVVVDDNIKQDITSLPKSLDGFHDETLEEYAEKLQSAKDTKRRNNDNAVCKLEHDAELDNILNSI